MNHLKRVLNDETELTLAETEYRPAHQLRFLTEHSSCAMCETTLEIRHDINREGLKVKEEAHCPSCGIRVRVAHHLMH